MIKRLLGIACAGTLMAVVVASGPAGANHSWNGYHWDGALTPVVVALDNHVGGSWGTPFNASVTDWDVSAVLDFSISGGAASASECSNSDPNPTPGEVEVCNDGYGANGWLGLARIWLTAGGHITQGQVLMNDTYFDTETYDDEIARRHVMCQELGHTFGLDHQHGPKGQSCMNDSWGLFSENFDSPNQHDYDQLVSIYCHLDGVSTCPSKGGGKKNAANNPHVHQDGAYTVLTWTVPAR
jgi:hypothetical protein